MTRYVAGDERHTAELVRQLDEDRSWLRHTGAAGELDRRLLTGAFEDELEEVRGQWRNHIRHLCNEHRLEVTRDARGFWRIVGSAADSNHQKLMPVDAVGPIENAVATAVTAAGGGRGEPPTPPVPVAAAGGPSRHPFDLAAHLRQLSSDDFVHRPAARIAVSARALATLARDDLLHDLALRDTAAMLIRRASESSHWHNCANYRTSAAARRIAEAHIATAHQYQAWCRSNLHHEHVVPCKVIYEMLSMIDARDGEVVRLLLHRFSLRATVTFDEDQRLRDAGLRASMPPGFYVPTDPLFLDPLARYRHVGLVDQLETRSGNLWFED